MSTFNLSQDISTLYPKGKVTKTAQKIIDAGFKKIEDLLWILPLRIQPTPKISSFANIKEGEIFKGKGEIVSKRSYPSYRAKGKGRVQLFNVQAVVRDHQSDNLTTLRWFNCYPNIKKQINELKSLTFYGPVSEFKGSLGISNPKIGENNDEGPYLIEYPTINGVSGTHLKKVFAKIKEEHWNSIPEILPQDFLDKHQLIDLKTTFKIIHGKTEIEEFVETGYEKAKERLIYNEFLFDQFKIMARKQLLKNKITEPVKFNQEEIENFITLFEYELTVDQKKATQIILDDLKSNVSMMRMIQGDVGCGKTTVAFISAFATIKDNKQVAFMCPTETLARQHYENAQKLFSKYNINVQLLLGSHTPKEKNAIYQDLLDGRIDFIIGTHSLFQDKVQFSQLQLVIIDEQHKFGVDQRLRLLSKGNNPHCLIMTATPIPRTLRLTQYGDLDITSIKTLPGGRKGSKTRIVTADTYQKFLSFVKTRVEIGEQVYIVAPAIEESETLDIENIESLKNKFTQFFPNIPNQVLHGKIKAQEKDKVINDFREKKFSILISTSVIEVGIDIPNTSIMAIYNPERFGLSSLHQLRGRVGRGALPGFCFLVSESEFSKEALQRLEIMEKTSDGFKIAEEDLKFRGEGDLFGVLQSGNYSTKKMANLFTHREIFDQVLDDLEIIKRDYTDYLEQQIMTLKQDPKISATI